MVTTNYADRFSERARKVLVLAQGEAQRFNHNYIGTEHILLGLAREGGGIAAKVLSNLGLELSKVGDAVELIISRHKYIGVGPGRRLTPAAKRVIELAVDEAYRLNHHYIGTEHLLLGLLREREGVAAGVLEGLGIKLEKVRLETANILNQPGKVMLLKRYVIGVYHGDSSHPCTCSDEELGKMCDLLPDTEEVKDIVGPFIRSSLPLPRCGRVDVQVTEERDLIKGEKE